MVKKRKKMMIIRIKTNQINKSDKIDQYKLMI